MGLFTQRPQEPSAWAALPGEPLRPTSPTERLADGSPAVDDIGLGGGVESIAIPVEPVAELPDGRTDEGSDETG